ncbi:E3 ubiquitin-protein ligase pellino homolog 1-like [Oscarella lobularis]|uniref:E3 ubiquitin-protein ligase pellino homolog 1-like n=1 Tax=Oscarella lobularis TaxID=121494 RepID=UPI0033141A37
MADDSAYLSKDGSSQESDGGVPRRRKRSKTPRTPQPQIVYGELVVVGLNGSPSGGNDGRYRHKFVLSRRPRGNGLKVMNQRTIVTPAQSKEKLLKQQQQSTSSYSHSVSMTINRDKSVVIDYDTDASTDMFQLGRSMDSIIDFIVFDMIPNPSRTAEPVRSNSTVSRYACRIVCERDPPYTARLYAAGFDPQHQIVLSEQAPKWTRKSDNMIDALTTNGVMLLQPQGGFDASSEPGLWREVSVAGDVYQMRKSRADRERGAPSPGESNILTDGCLIDLCGVTLLWRSSISRSQTPSDGQVDALRRRLNASRPQCPVGLNTLQFSSTTSASGIDSQPYAYLKCGHVHGQHEWDASGGGGERRTCPLCRKVGPYVKLRFGLESAFYLDTSSKTYAFVPCGHVASEKTVKYWSKVPIPYGPEELLARCPFCAYPIMGYPGYVQLLWDSQ